MKFTFPPESRPLDGYTIKRGIHRGGFGEVYYALSDAGKEVALKLLQNNADIELRGVSHCLNLKHPNLVTIFDIRRDQDQDHWIIMEFMSGRSLDQVVMDYPDGMPVEKICHWLRGITAGLEFLHDRGIVHRDLKPANVYGDQDAVKLGDVGLSKFISQSRRGAQTQSVGTVYYMAPEVARGTYGREVDVYALGIMLFEMLTGQVPFDGESTGEILMKHLTEKPDLSRVPESVRPVLERALQKDPNRRFSSAAQLEQAFLAAIGQEDEFPHDAQPAVHAVPVQKPQRPYESPKPPNYAAAAGKVPGRQTHNPWYVEHASLLKVVGIVILVLAVVSPDRIDGSLRLPLVIGAIIAVALGMRRTMAHVPTAPPASRPAQYERPRDRGRYRPAGNMRRYGQAVYRRRHGSQLNPATARRVSIRNRVQDISGSMVVAVIASVLIAFGLHLLTNFVPSPALIGFFALSTICGSWAILLLSKVQEGRPLDCNTRRFSLLATGIAVGLAIWGLDQFLLVHLPVQAGGDPGLFQRLGRHTLLDQQTQPTLAGYLVFFGILFGLRRWWWHADSFRSSRFRISSALVTLTLAYIVSCVFAFPHDWAMMWAVTLSSVVQLSAAWTPPSQRVLEAETDLNA